MKSSILSFAFIAILGCARGTQQGDGYEAGASHGGDDASSAEGGGGAHGSGGGALATGGAEGTAAAGGAPSCDAASGAVEFDGHCYRLFASVPTTWQGARTECVDWGGELVAVASAAEAAFVTSMAGSARAWVGLNDLASEGVFEWSNGETLSFVNFVAGQPDNNEGNEHCVEVVPAMGGAWNDLPCDYPLVALCER